ncbi:MAG: redoxin domain-containing protein [Planctomycetes bacterium]|nr:redoxin domain-containing protein [Planctomycetota bacterium]
MVLGASFDSKEANGKFRAKYEFPFPLLCDTEQKLAKAYGAEQADKPYPARAAVVIGPDGKVVKWWGKVDAKTFPETVLAELPAGKKG